MAIIIRDIIDPGIATSSSAAAESLAMANLLAGALADSGAFGLYINPNNPVDSDKCVASASNLPETAASGTVYCTKDTRKFYQYTSSGREEIQNGIVVCNRIGVYSSANVNFYSAVIVVNGNTCVALSTSGIGSSAAVPYVYGVCVDAFYANGNQTYIYTKGPAQSSSGGGKSYYKAAITSNGVLFGIAAYRDAINYAPTVTGTIIVAKSNGDYPIIVCGANLFTNSAANTASNRSLNVLTCNYEDTNYMLTNSSTGSNQNPDIYQYNTSAGQSVLVPFAAYGRSSEKSFSPYAFWKSVSGEYQRAYKKVHIGDKNYVTDGWWLLRDL